MLSHLSIFNIACVEGFLYCLKKRVLHIMKLLKKMYSLFREKGFLFLMRKIIVRIKRLLTPPRKVRISPVPFEEKAPAWDGKTSIKTIAFYLPQFHRFPENDAWWGEGFTEWTNVRRSRPMFSGHCQPEEPHPALGYYDLSDIEVMRKQAELAKEYGIYGFCFHHYWFSGKRLMEKPVDLLLDTPSIDLRFCLNWANENWARRWDGADHEVLIAQNHSPEDDEAFMVDVLRYFKDPRYIRIQGRPLFLVYRPGILPDMQGTLSRWKAVCTRHGESVPYFVMCMSFAMEDFKKLGFDAAVQFPPHTPWETGDTIRSRVVVENQDKSFRGKLFAYDELKDSALQALGKDVIPCVVPSWDNTPRRLFNSSIYAGSTPASYTDWLFRACQFSSRNIPESLVFINAWNEWAEGAHLEPSKAYGYAYLNATLAVLKQFECPSVPDKKGTPSPEEKQA